ncbi:hypothetical protein [Lactococcus lactis]|uniref:Uncharacterized protein n=1 Tax=Lactococcus lactis subsp. lactis A12 TaxID=1137134 RepID=S6EWK0_LACLL|nr:hypothetical protein [Lactococcus lactis]CDG03748.1 Putative uncharacterized protein [Lactococcus lactis subsp. lactis A12]SBW29599.1 Hypothetical protein LLA12_00424 [Lactococcus lactis subsp. lactis]
MKNKIREQIWAEAEDFINPTTLTCYEWQEQIVCVGYPQLGAVGWWAIYTPQGGCLQAWSELTPSDLVTFIKSEAKERHFLQLETFEYQWIHWRQKDCLLAWAKANKVNRVGVFQTYFSIWNIRGNCLLEWGALLNDAENQAHLDSLKRWQERIEK